VPAADEQDTIVGCLRALATANAVLAGRRGWRARIIVVLDGCHDATGRLARAWPDVALVVTSNRNVGATRRAGSFHALRGDRPLHEVWLAHTDADSEVPPNWLADMVELADRGADLVVGTVLPDNGLPDAARRQWLERHDLREGHRHVHGANLGIRGSSYSGLGGWRPLAIGEDEDLVTRAVAARLPIARTAVLPVRTSSRTTSRVAGGFADYVRGLDAPVA
jgi:cellulose synthase/poly-beta-1,6-N-acetylglucosamine synthase-like glycosyltransferase